MRTAMRLSTLSAPLASFAANSKPFFLSSRGFLPSPYDKGRGGGEVGTAPRLPRRDELHHGCGTRWAGLGES